MSRAATKKTTKKRPAKKSTRSARTKRTAKKTTKKGVKRSPRKTDAEKAQAVQEYLSGETAEQVAKKYGVSLQSIYAWKRKFGKTAAQMKAEEPKATGARGAEPDEPAAEPELDLGLGGVLRGDPIAPDGGGITLVQLSVEDLELLRRAAAILAKLQDRSVRLVR